MTPAERIASLLFPLDGFYAEGGRPLPRIAPLAGEDVPEPYRSLLVHDRDMTSTLEGYFGSGLHLRVLEVREDRGVLRREVVLLTDAEDRAVEFGAIEIRLHRFDEEPRRLIREGHRPVGLILREHRIVHRCRPSAFFTIAADRVVSAALGLRAPALLYGRHNEVLDAYDQRLAEVAEILPPLE